MAASANAAPTLPLPHPAGGPTLIGMVHLAALPGAPRYDGDLQQVRRRALADADALRQGGIDALLVENFFDAPFYPAAVPAETIAAMTELVGTLVRSNPLPVGVNVLRNDGCGALAVAVATGAAFVRVNVLVGARLTDQGIVEGIAHELARRRRALAAERVRVLADVAVKHSAPLAPYELGQQVEDTLRRGGADAVIVTGSGTGRAIDPDRLRAVRVAAAGAPVLAGSGVDAANASTIAPLVEGIIVGTACKRDGRIDAPVDPERVRAIVAAVRG